MRYFGFRICSFGVYSPQDIIFQNIILFASPTRGFYFASGFHGAALENVQIIKNPGDATHLITLAADGVHFNQVNGDIVIENSQVSSQGDDGLNIVTPMTSGATIKPKAPICDVEKLMGL